MAGRHVSWASTFLLPSLPSPITCRPKNAQKCLAHSRCSNGSSLPISHSSSFALLPCPFLTERAVTLAYGGPHELWGGPPWALRAALASSPFVSLPSQLPLHWPPPQLRPTLGLCTCWARCWPFCHPRPTLAWSGEGLLTCQISASSGAPPPDPVQAFQ